MIPFVQQMLPLAFHLTGFQCSLVPLVLHLEQELPRVVATIHLWVEIRRQLAVVPGFQFDRMHLRALVTGSVLIGLELGLEPGLGLAPAPELASTE